jgi:hypothetical protein
VQHCDHAPDRDFHHAVVHADGGLGRTMGHGEPGPHHLDADLACVHDERRPPVSGRDLARNRSTIEHDVDPVLVVPANEH